MPGQPRAVVDTNVLVRGVLNPTGLSGRILAALRRGRFTMVTSNVLLDELARVLLGPSVQRVAPLSQAAARRWRTYFERKAIVVPGLYRDVRVVPTDPTDDMLFACALEGRAEYVVSGDENDVRAVKAWKPYETAIQVVGAPYFVRGVLRLPAPRRRKTPEAR